VNQLRQWPPQIDVVERARDGDRNSIAALFSAGYPRLIGFFRVAGAPPPDAEDLATATIEAMVKNLPRLRAPVAFEAWFWSIARAQLRTWIRKRRRPRAEPPISPEPSHPDERAEESEEHSLVVEALGALSPRDRELLWLREVEELSYEEIGGRLRSSVGTVRVACHRARKRLEEAYQRLETGGDHHLDQ
jgi:RNA polymerase sigma factor (sigma-70 family)